MFRLLLTIFFAGCALASFDASADLPLASASAAAASAAAGRSPGATARPDLLAFVQTEAAGSVPGAHARIEVTLGQLDPRLQLAPCARIEPFIPPGTRLWGRTHVGLRCAEGAHWSVRLPVTVRVFGPALVAARGLAAGTTPLPDDLTTAEVEWTREAQGVVTDATQLDDRVLTRALAAGQPLPLAALRAPQVIAAGDPVKLNGQGRGFAVSADAVALGPAQAGQPVRVRTESGRVLTGTARAGRRVDIAF
jgi:flagellar basal body P-ring formation protein FlgA